MASFKIETKHLRGEITPTSGTHIFFDCNTGSYAGVRNSFSVTVRGVVYGVSAHFYKWPTGEWGLGQQDDAPSTRFYNHIYISRRDSYTKSDISHTARVTVAALLNAEVAAWLKDNQGALIEAQAEDTAREVKRREEKIAEHEAAITRLKLEIAALRKAAQ
jgi:hypothetical protein